MTGRWVGRSVRTSFFFAFFSKTTRYILLATFGPPTRRVKTSVVKKWKTKSNFKFVKKFRTKRVYFPKKVLRNPLYFDRLWWFRFFKHWFSNLTKTPWDFFCLLQNRTIGYSEVQKFQNLHKTKGTCFENKKHSWKMKFIMLHPYIANTSQIKYLV